MIRIDEIYNNVIWPWLSQNRFGTRLYFCDPPGVSSPDALLNHGRDDIDENDFVFCHDQEPIHIDLHKALFDEVYLRSEDGIVQRTSGNIIVSERGEFVDTIVKLYGWRPHYYFYHGWAALDWYRGYNRTFLISQPEDRCPTRAFFSPNRIVGGKRDHRVLFLYHVFSENLEHNWISAPFICPQENVSILDIAARHQKRYPDIVRVMEQASLPKLFPGESTQLMTSCWLSNFAESEDSLVYVVTETVYFGDRLHLTEKIFKPIVLGMPFIVVAPCGSLQYLRSYGFKTFGHVWDESYDEETDDFLRLEKVIGLLKQFDRLSVKEKLDIYKTCLPIINYNKNHFFNGDFEDILWEEFVTMLQNI